MTAEPVDLITGRARGRTTVTGQVGYSPPETSMSVDSGPSSQAGAVEVRLRFELTARTARSEYVAAFLQVRFDDPRIEAVDLRVPDAHWAGTPARHGISVSVLSDGAFGWLFGDPVGTTPIPAACQAYALLTVPFERTDLAVTLRVDTTTVRRSAWLPGARRTHSRVVAPTRFTIARPDGWSDQVRTAVPVPLPASQPLLSSRSSVRLCMAADLERFSRFRLPEASRAQQRFVRILAGARKHAGIDDTDVDLQESGDGQFAVLPPGLDETDVIPRLVEGLRLALTETNSDLSEHARLRLRVALHRGHVARAPNGWVGRPTIAVHRMLDSDALRAALAHAPASDFALIVPDLLYQEVIVHRYGLLNPDEFVAVDVAVPAKNFAETAWTYAPKR